MSRSGIVESYDNSIFAFFSKNLILFFIVVIPYIQRKQKH